MTVTPIVAPYGTWSSPLQGATVYQSASTIYDLLTDEHGKLYHIESCHAEAGRFVLFETKFPADSVNSRIRAYSNRIVPRHSDVRSKVHEYGGGAAKIHHGFVYWSELQDGRIYRRHLSSSAHEPGEAVTPESSVDRYADFDFHPVARHLLICVREDHTIPSKVKNSIILINTVDKTVDELCPARADGFYAFPRFSGHHGTKVAWIEWRHPDMPWDGTELFYAEFDSSADYKDYATLQPRKIAGAHSSVSINDVKWDVFRTDKLYYLSDETGYTNLWSIDLAETHPRPKLVMDPIPNDLSEPLWRLAPSWYAILSANTALIAPNIGGVRKLCRLDLDTGRLTQIENEYRDVTGLCRLSENRAAFLAGKWDEPTKIVIITLGSRADTATFSELEFAKESRLPGAYISKGECMSLPIIPEIEGVESSNDKSRDIHVVLYPPTNPDYEPLKGELPPSIVMVHGGPTARAPPVFTIFHQYFTTRGFAVIDVNYGGSSGYGRAYHRRLYGGWGVVDEQDTIRAVEELGNLGKLDSKRVCIRGSSAGGFTTLACLATSEVFKGAVLLYAISDVILLAGDSSKFELMGGALEEIPELYDERSPVNKADRIKAKLLIFQGLKDNVVNPERTRDLARKIEIAGGQVETVFYEDEGHKIRKFENLTDSLLKTEAFLLRAFEIERN